MKSLRVAVLVGLMSSSAFANVLVYDAFLSGPNEVPTNTSPGTGFAIVTFDTITNLMHVQVNFTGLDGTTTASHIHAPTATPGAGTAGVATTTPTFTGFPLGVTSGTYDHTFDMTLSTSYNPVYVAANGGTIGGAEAALLAAIAADRAYLNIHSNLFPGGEIRGFLVPTPEPGTLLLAGAALLGLGILRRK